MSPEEMDALLDACALMIHINLPPWDGKGNLIQFFGESVLTAEATTLGAWKHPAFRIPLNN